MQTGRVLTILPVFYYIAILSKEVFPNITNSLLLDESGLQVIKLYIVVSTYSLVQDSSNYNGLHPYLFHTQTDVQRMRRSHLPV